MDPFPKILGIGERRERREGREGRRGVIERIRNNSGGCTYTPAVFPEMREAVVLICVVSNCRLKFDKNLFLTRGCEIHCRICIPSV